MFCTVTDDGAGKEPLGRYYSAELVMLRCKCEWLQAFKLPLKKYFAISTFVCIYVCMYLCMFVYVCVYIYTQTYKYIYLLFIYIAYTTRRTLCFYYKDQSMNAVCGSKCSLYVRIISNTFRQSVRPTSHLPVNTNSKQTVHDADGSLNV